MRRKFPKGAVIILIAASFLFNAKLSSQSIPGLSIKKSKPGYFELNQTRDLVEGTWFSYRYEKTADTLTSDSSLSTINPNQEVKKKFRMKKSPTVAVLLSAALPGAGQFYNESYWKVPIIAGLIGYFGYEYFRQNNLYKDYRDRYTATQTPENPSGDLNLKALREFYRDQRDDFVWYFMIAYVVNLVDAYVDAHLFDFDVKDEYVNTLGKVNRSYKLKMNFKF